MKTLGNVIWFILGGFISFLSWGAIGILWSLTIIGIPVGQQCFKIAKLSLAPFGKDVRFYDDRNSWAMNILWLIFGGFPLAVEEVSVGAALCLTIVGIPFGLQHFKQAKLALMPFGAEIYRV